MKVFVLNRGWDYEGESTVGVYSTLDAANKAAADMDTKYVDSVLIHEFEVDEAPKFGVFGEPVTHIVK